VEHRLIEAIIVKTGLVLNETGPVSYQIRPVSHETRVISHEVRPVSHEIGPVSTNTRPVSCSGELNYMKQELLHVKQDLSDVKRSCLYHAALPHYLRNGYGTTPAMACGLCENYAFPFRYLRTVADMPSPGVDVKKPSTWPPILWGAYGKAELFRK